MKKIILAVDSFKGCLTSVEIEREMKEAILQCMPDVSVEAVPVADGGEGTLSVIADILGAEYRACMAHNPLMEPMMGRYAVVPSRQMALVEMAEVSGLPLIADEKRNPMLTTTYGTGELIRDALDNGCTNFIIGIGGSATNDAGIGMLQALGYEFRDNCGRALGQGGQLLGQIADWNDARRHPLIDHARFTVACDVTNPFCGPQGAAYVFAPQKGADEAMLQQLDKGMQSFAELIASKQGVDIRSVAGAGAAGGMGGGMIAFLHAQLKSGGELLLDLSEFDHKLDDADLVITGEGKMDSQTLMGKIPGKVLELAALHGVPTVGIAGRIEQQEQLLKAGFGQLYAVSPVDMPLALAMQPKEARQNLRETVRQMCHDFGNKKR